MDYCASWTMRNVLRYVYVCQVQNSIPTFLGVAGYTCEGCERMYTSLNFLQRHRRYYCSSRTITKVWECNLCGEKFTSLCDLNSHTSTHADSKQCQSTQNNKTFTQSTHRNRIFRTHAGEKPYQCPQCNKAFNQAGALTTHLRTHTGEKPYQCPQCNKAFSHSNSLAMHLRSHKCS